MRVFFYLSNVAGVNSLGSVAQLTATGIIVGASAKSGKGATPRVKVRAGDLLMFEDQTVDITCPNCGRKNSILVCDFEASSEARISCHHCGVVVKVEAEEFRQRLARVRKELEEIQLEARRATKSRRPRKDDFQI
jgi:transcription elongation factor Elf1